MKPADERYRPVPNRGDHNCFACGPENPVGLAMKFYSDGQSVVSWLRVDEHLCGWDNLLHGGVISTLLDEIMSWTIIHLLQKFILTKRITVDFLKPLYVDTPLKVEGRIREVRNDREAVVEGVVYDEKRGPCAHSVGTFALLKPEIARRMKIMSPEAIDGFMQLLEAQR